MKPLSFSKINMWILGSEVGGPRLNSLRSSSSKNLTGQAGIQNLELKIQNSGDRGRSSEVRKDNDEGVF